MTKCIDKEGREYFAFLYLYDDNIVYISRQEHNEYDINDLINVLKKNIPNLQGVFYVNYAQDTNGKFILDQKQTTRLAKRLL